MCFGCLVAQVQVQLGPAVVARLNFSEEVVTQKKASGWQVHEESAVGRLARFFPEAAPVRIAVTVSRKAGGHTESEATVVEFGTPREALFACRLPLEFADKIHLQDSDGLLQTEAWVVAVQYRDGQAAVAARFAQEMPQWVVKS